MDVLDRDFFTDAELFQDPAPWYAAARERGPVWREPNRGVVVLTRLEDLLEVYSDYERFSACVATLGPLIPLPQPEPGERWAEVLERRRAEIPMGDMLPSLDPPRHTRERALAGKLFTPNRLKENEEFMAGLADELIDEMLEQGEVDFLHAYAQPFTLLVIADLLGVPRSDHPRFRRWLGGNQGNVGNADGEHGGDQIFARLAPYFTGYIEERRAASADDAMSQLAQVRYPDGDLPEVEEIVRIASILFAAGQETTARLLAAGMRVIAEQPALADELRSDPSGIPNFVEECLRLEGPIKSTFRLALEDTKIGDMEVPAGTIVMCSVGAANRDATVFDDPDRFDPKRRNAKRNIAFGHGEHFCPGASLARTEAYVSFKQLLARLDDIEIAEPDKLHYAETFIIRGLEALPIRFQRRG